jgi:hypothetical protein
MLWPDQACPPTDRQAGVIRCEYGQPAVRPSCRVVVGHYCSVGQGNGIAVHGAGPS